MTTFALTRSGLQGKPGATELAEWRRKFDECHALHWPGFVPGELLEWLLPRLTAASYRVRLHGGVENERVLADTSLLFTLFFLLNDPQLFRVIREITGCGDIADFYGRVGYRHAAGGAGHYYPWHNDCGDDRLIGLSINLSPEPYTGGVFQLRRKGESELRFTHHNTGLGDAMLFRVRRDLEHHVTRVEGDRPRLIFVGWFRGPGHRSNPLPPPELAADSPVPAPPLDPTSRVRVPSTVLWREEGEALFCHTVANGLYHRLEGVGRSIWEALGATGNVATASERLLAEYEVAPAALAAELQRFGGELRARGLLEEIPA